MVIKYNIPGVIGLPWFLEGGGYIVYDDFESYGLGAFSSNDWWDVDTTGGGTVTISNQNEVTGTANKVLKLHAYQSAVLGSESCFVDSASTMFVANKYYWADLYCYSHQSAIGGSGSQQVRINTTNYLIHTLSISDTRADRYGSSYCRSSLLVVRNSSGLWDAYVGGYKVVSDLTEITSIGFRVVCSNGHADANATSTMYIANVRYI